MPQEKKILWELISPKTGSAGPQAEVRLRCCGTQVYSYSYFSWTSSPFPVNRW